FLMILLPLLESIRGHPMYILISPGRNLEMNEAAFYQSEPIEVLPLMEDPAKFYSPNDIFGDVHKLVIGVQNFVQHPPSSLYSAFSQLQTTTKKDDKKQKQKPLGQKVAFDPFGSLALTLGWSAGFQVSNSLSF
ncbi:hypothetical protein KR074_001154, partial [Drosophila pseudoananassae]